MAAAAEVTVAEPVAVLGAEVVAERRKMAVLWVLRMDNRARTIADALVTEATKAAVYSATEAAAEAVATFSNVNAGLFARALIPPVLGRLQKERATR